MRVDPDGNIPTEYAMAIAEATTVEGLRAAVKKYHEITADAQFIVNAMTDVEFKEWRQVVAKERSGVFSGVQMVMKYGALLAPTLMVLVLNYAKQAKLSWNQTYLLLRGHDYILLDDQGRAYLRELH